MELHGTVRVRHPELKTVKSWYLKKTLLFLVILILLPIVSARTLEVGVIPNWKDGESLRSFEQNHNVTVDRWMTYFNVQTGEEWRFTQIRNSLATCGNTTTLEMGLQFDSTPEHPSPLRALRDGVYDSSLYRVATELKAYDDQYHKIVIVRPLPEFFGWWTQYGIYNVNNSRDDLVPAFKRIVDILRSTGNENIRIDWNVGGLQGWGRVTVFDNESYFKYYPGDDYVDSASIDMYNVPSISGMQWISFHDLMKPSYDELVAGLPLNVPINIGETGSGTSQYGNKTQWITEAFTSMMYNFTRMENIDFFFVDYGNSPPGDVDLDTPEQEAAFREGVRLIRDYNSGQVVWLPPTPEDGAVMTEQVTLSATCRNGDVRIYFTPIDSRVETYPLVSTTGVYTTNATPGVYLYTASCNDTNSVIYDEPSRTWEYALELPVLRGLNDAPMQLNGLAPPDQETQDSCASTRTTIYAGFIIVSLLTLVIAIGFMFGGDPMAAALSVAALGILVTLGFYVTGLIAQIACSIT